MAQQIGDNSLIDTWASSGAITEPDLTKKTTGWTLGEKPPHEFMNFLQNEFGQKINYVIRSGVPAHNTATPYAINDVVSSGGFIWMAIAANTNSVPSLVNTNWRVVNGNATQTLPGLIEIATDAETQTGTDSTRAVTPASLSARTATETRTGVVELATQAEANAGIDASRALTPATARGAYGVSTRTSAALALNASQTISHGLGRLPNNVTYSLVVISAVAGWAAGDEIYRWIDGYTAQADSAISLGADANNFYIPTGPNQLTILNRVTGAPTTVSPTNFQVRIKYN